ncbi:type I restriction-modification enzyme R subunit C-terminal domain-containing protein [Streptomyces sp. NPDC005355]|uniref:type I restriction-modification enzyme R subunit C-terminal domain-containing protein n=1 Tax=Streptomyces sp. NPDC005355 TaxID=3157038 RepID=UPI0033BBB496
MLAEGVASEGGLEQARHGEGGLGLFLRRIRGLDRQAAEAAFAEFMVERGLTSRQTHFLDLIVDFIAKNGWIRMQHLYKAPFTDRGLIDDFFTDEEIEELRVVFRTLRTRAEPADLAA